MIKRILFQNSTQHDAHQAAPGDRYPKPPVNEKRIPA